MKIGIIGYGALGEQIHYMLSNYNKITATFFFDDNSYKNQWPHSYPFSDYSKNEFKDLDFYICLGYKHLEEKFKIINSLISLGRNIPTLIHPSSYVSPTARIGAGSIIYPMCNIDKDTVIGKGVLINNSVTLSHNNKIGDCCYIAPGVVTSGFVEIGCKTFAGTRSVIANDISIGENVIIGIGTVVTSGIRSNMSAIGNPMRTLRNSLKIQ